MNEKILKKLLAGDKFVLTLPKFSSKYCFYYLIKKKMKKLVLLLAVSFSATLFSCGSSDKAAEATDSVAVVDETVIEEVAVVDTNAVDTVTAVVDSLATVANN